VSSLKATHYAATTTKPPPPPPPFSTHFFYNMIMEVFSEERDFIFLVGDGKSSPLGNIFQELRGPELLLPS
jgi:hypothetical protein